MKLTVFFFFFVSMLGESRLLSPFASSVISTGSVVITSDGASGHHVMSSSDKRLNRKLLKVNGNCCRRLNLALTRNKRNHWPTCKQEQEVVLEDYGLIDPTPATKTSVGPKPIDHGSPLIPFIPQQPPPTYDALSPPTG